MLHILLSTCLSPTPLLLALIQRKYLVVIFFELLYNNSKTIMNRNSRTEVLYEAFLKIFCKNHRKTPLP